MKNKIWLIIILTLILIGVALFLFDKPLTTQQKQQCLLNVAWKNCNNIMIFDGVTDYCDVKNPFIGNAQMCGYACETGQQNQELYWVAFNQSQLNQCNIR